MRTEYLIFINGRKVHNTFSLLSHYTELEKQRRARPNDQILTTQVAQWI